MSARKILLLGDIGVGKTSITRRLVFDHYDTGYKATLGVDIYAYTVTDAGPNKDQSVELSVWDTDGNVSEHVFREKHYIIGASAALIVGDVTRPGSQEMMIRLAEMCAEKLAGRHVAFVLNKLDLLDTPHRLELPSALKTLAHPLVMTSAKTGDNIRDAFRDAASAIVRRGY
jgi:Ras-related protein Rab-5C